MIKIAITLMVVASILSFSLPEALAQDPIKKLGRGIANVLTGALEIPLNIVDAQEEEGYIAAVTYGIVKGVAMTALRTVVGAYEIVTFLIPIPFHYDPILEPEFLMSDENF